MAGYSSAYDLSMYDEMFASMATNARNKTTDFLHCVCSEHLNFKRSPQEVGDIRTAVQECLRLFCSTLGKVNSAFTVGRIFPVGSMAEGTRIIEPSEFDFIVALKEWSGDVKVERIVHTVGLTEIGVHSQIAPRKFGNVVLAQQTHASVTFPKVTHMSTPDDDICGFLSNTLGRFWNYKHYEKEVFSKTFEACKTACIEMPSGSMTYHEFPDFHGPVYSVGLMWQPTDKKSSPLKVDVDIAPAIFVQGVRKVFSEEDVLGLFKKYTEKILEVDSFLLMPARKCFDPQMHYQFAFTNTEVELIKDLSLSHKRCIKLLKWFFHDHTMISSFILKTCVLMHNDNCDNQDSEWPCIFDVLKILIRGLPIINGNDQQRRLGFCNIFIKDNLIQYRLYRLEQVNRVRQYMLNILTILMEVGSDTSSLCFKTGYERCLRLITEESINNQVTPYTYEDSMLDSGKYKT